MIRQANSQDVARVTQIAQAGYAKYIARIGKPPAPMVADFASHIARGEVWVFCASDLPSPDETSPDLTRRDLTRLDLTRLDEPRLGVLGYVVCFEKDAAFELDNIAVDAAAHGHGVGRALVAHVEELARARGLAAVSLYTNVKMTENLTLYPHLGFVETGRRTESGFDRVFFRKSI